MAGERFGAFWNTWQPYPAKIRSAGEGRRELPSSRGTRAAVNGSEPWTLRSTLLHCGRNLNGGYIVLLADFRTIWNLLLPSRALPKALGFESVLFAPGD